jgi:hypothetical protein
MTEFITRGRFVHTAMRSGMISVNTTRFPLTDFMSNVAVDF